MMKKMSLTLPDKTTINIYNEKLEIELSKTETLNVTNAVTNNENDFSEAIEMGMSKQNNKIKGREIENIKRHIQETEIMHGKRLKSSAPPARNLIIQISTIDPKIAQYSKNITFDEKTHTYFFHDEYLGSIQNRLSVTELIKQTFNETFFGTKIAKAIAKQIKNGDAKKLETYSFINPKISIDDIAEKITNSWTMKGHLASTYGTMMHAIIENYYKTGVFEYRADLHNELASFCKFLLEYRMQPWAMEYYLFDKNLRLAGSVDAIFRSPTDDYRGNDLIIVDWKRTKGIDESFCNKIFEGKKYPFTKRFQYSVQVNIYKYLLERQFKGKKRVVGMRLWIHNPLINDVNFEFYEIPLMEDVKIYMDRLMESPNLLLDLIKKPEDDKSKIYKPNKYQPSKML
ncbi:MAG: hypothetical protein ACRYGG_18720 [Janthinobacterium lividum]